MPVLVGVELVHRALEERREQAPVALAPMRDVVVVVVGADVLERDARVLVGEPAARAAHEPERARLAAEIVLRRDEVVVLRASRRGSS